MVAAAYRRSDFLSRLLLLAANAAQGSTGCDRNGAANMTNDSFDDESARGKRRNSTSNFVIDSGATIHCINDISLFDQIYEDHPGIQLKVRQLPPR